MLSVYLKWIVKEIKNIKCNFFFRKDWGKIKKLGTKNHRLPIEYVKKEKLS